MKRCGRCGEQKALKEFAWRRKSKGQRHNYCRPCHAAYHREHYLANKARYINQAARWKVQARREQTERLIEFFATHPCVDCGEGDPVVLEFDHLRDKSFEVATGLTRFSWARIVAEMKKCEVVCANCHRRRTARRRGSVRAMLAEREEP